MSAAPHAIRPAGMKLPPAIHFFPITAPSAVEMSADTIVSNADDAFAFHFLRLIAPSAMSRVPIPPPKMRDLVLPAMANLASPPSATNRPHGRVRQKSCIGNQPKRRGFSLPVTSLVFAASVPPSPSSGWNSPPLDAVPGSARATTRLPRLARKEACSEGATNPA